MCTVAPDDVENCELRIDSPVDRKTFYEVLDSYRHNILRGKGIVDFGSDKKYVEVVNGTLFSKSTCSVSTLSATRSYWEKITILHALCHGSKMRDRMSRHFYDTYMMDQRGITKEALADTSVLDQVVQNKNLLFRDAKASYETAQIGTLRLVPKEEILQELKEDYLAMEEMFMSDFPTFEEIIRTLEKLEQSINSV